jgi:hypothetical protein
MRDWQPATADNPCPKCGKTDWCRIGWKVIHCMRLQNDRPAKGGGWYHGLDPSAAPSSLPTPPPRKQPTPQELDGRFRRNADRWSLAAATKISEFAKQLGVSRKSLLSLGIGWNGVVWTIPERGPVRTVLGIATRSTDGRKKMMMGSHHGLIVPTTYCSTSNQPILLVEGMTDVAAALTLGISAIGRPSNCGGISLLIDCLWNYRGPIIVMGENDKRAPKMPVGMIHKLDCRGCPFCWPGKYGADTTAKSLRCELPQPQPKVAIRFPQLPAKDLRTWLNSGKMDPENTVSCYRAGRSLLRQLGVK